PFFARIPAYAGTTCIGVTPHSKRVVVRDDVRPTFVAPAEAGVQAFVRSGAPFLCLDPGLRRDDMYLSHATFKARGCSRRCETHLRRSGGGRSPGIRAQRRTSFFAWIPAYAGRYVFESRHIQSARYLAILRADRLCEIVTLFLPGRALRAWRGSLFSGANAQAPVADKRSRPCGALKSSAGPIGTMPVGLIILWLW